MEAKGCLDPGQPETKITRTIIWIGNTGESSRLQWCLMCLTLPGLFVYFMALRSLFVVWARTWVVTGLWWLQDCTRRSLSPLFSTSSYTYSKYIDKFLFKSPATLSATSISPLILIKHTEKQTNTKFESETILSSINHLYTTLRYSLRLCIS